MRDRLIYPQKPEYWGHYDFLQPTLNYHSRKMANSELMENFNYAYKVFYKKADVLSMARKSRIPQGFFRRTVKAGIIGGLRHPLRMREDFCFCKYPQKSRAPKLLRKLLAIGNTQKSYI